MRQAEDAAAGMGVMTVANFVAVTAATPSQLATKHLQDIGGKVKRGGKHISRHTMQREEKYKQQGE
jgi:hypothetical protein